MAYIDTDDWKKEALKLIKGGADREETINALIELECPESIAIDLVEESIEEALLVGYRRIFIGLDYVCILICHELIKFQCCIRNII